MANLKNIEALVEMLDDKDPYIKILNEIHQTLEWFYQWFKNLEEAISKEN